MINVGLDNSSEAVVHLSASKQESGSIQSILPLVLNHMRIHELHLCRQVSKAFGDAVNVQPIRNLAANILYAIFEKKVREKAELQSEGQIDYVQYGQLCSAVSHIQRTFQIKALGAFFNPTDTKLRPTLSQIKRDLSAADSLEHTLSLLNSQQKVRCLSLYLTLYRGECKEFFYKNTWDYMKIEYPPAIHAIFYLMYCGLLSEECAPPNVLDICYFMRKRGGENHGTTLPTLFHFFSYLLKNMADLNTEQKRRLDSLMITHSDIPEISPEDQKILKRDISRWYNNPPPNFTLELWRKRAVINFLGEKEKSICIFEKGAWRVAAGAWQVAAVVKYFLKGKVQAEVRESMLDLVRKRIDTTSRQVKGGNSIEECLAKEKTALETTLEEIECTQMPTSPSKVNPGSLAAVSQRFEERVREIKDPPPTLLSLPDDIFHIILGYLEFSEQISEFSEQISSLCHVAPRLKEAVGNYSTRYDVATRILCMIFSEEEKEAEFQVVYQPPRCILYQKVFVVVSRLMKMYPGLSSPLEGTKPTTSKEEKMSLFLLQVIRHLHREGLLEHTLSPLSPQKKSLCLELCSKLYIEEFKEGMNTAWGSLERRGGVSHAIFYLMYCGVWSEECKFEDLSSVFLLLVEKDKEKALRAVHLFLSYVSEKRGGLESEQKSKLDARMEKLISPPTFSTQRFLDKYLFVMLERLGL